ncbi:hypothetical protein M3Y94_01121700 [Aphelenchoides besseyi]|nr:hypothetical protein M3Y94_01121700 [Aphelenchoides besseyi]KAI6219261.1 hypothetical protein M3Y95_01120500 [Aphelenchoides besseyi]
MIWVVGFALLFVLSSSHPLGNSSHETTTEDDNSQCTDGVHNLIKAQSDLIKPKPALIKNFSGTVYTHDSLEASCHQKRPTVLLPGYVKLIGGELHVPKKFDLLKSSVLKLDVKSASFDDLCINGESQYIALPNSFCTVDLCKFIGNEKCEILQEPGVHTIAELEVTAQIAPNLQPEKLGFNSTLELPEPPSLLGISLLDLFSGEFSFGFTVESEGVPILDVQIPVNDKYLQIGVTDD